LSFPVYFNLFGHRVHPHLVLELIAYSAGFQLYLFLRKRWSRVAVPVEQNMWLIVGCVFGALVGSKALAFLESFSHYSQHLSDPRTWFGGKTIVGGLLGGWVGVEIVKWWFGIRHSTGDAFVFPLIVGMCIGRVGCFLTGLDDHTHGVHSALPWAVNFGDGPRHPTQLYEIVFLLLLAVVIFIRSRIPYPNGQLFRLFMFGYLGFRFFAEFIKPRETPIIGLSAIQLVCMAGAGICVWQLTRSRTMPLAESHAARAAAEA
jgi:phosphatidylglycerol:prolipoprotein diacylglycerol transferase